MTDIVFIGGKSYIIELSCCTSSQVLANSCELAGFSTYIIDHSWELLNTDPEKFLAAVLTKISSETMLLAISTTLLAISKDSLRMHQKETGKNLRDGWWGKVGKQKIVWFINSVREKFPNIQVVFGGSQLIYKHELRLNVTDWAIVGQGESCLVALLRHLKYNNPIKYTDKGGIREITDSDYPYSQFNLSKNRPSKNQIFFPRTTHFQEIARGCIFRCAYCNYTLNGKKQSDFTRPIHLIRDDIIQNYETHGIQIYKILDDTIVDSKSKYETINAAFSNLPFEMYWGGYFRLDLFYNRPEWIKVLYDNGLRGMALGIETFSTTAGELIGKKLGKERILKTLQMIRSIAPEIHIHCFFIFGLPGETLDELKETHDWICNTNLIDSAAFNRLYVRDDLGYKSSEMMLNPEKFGLILSNHQYYSPSAFDSAEDLEIWVEICKREYFEARSTLNGYSGWFAITNMIDIMIQSEYPDPIEAYNVLRHDWSKQPRIKKLNELKQAAMSIRQSYLNKLLNGEQNGMLHQP